MEGLSFLPLILVVAVFYLMIIRPQQKQQKQRKLMLDSLKKNDKVITIGGIHGTIKEIQDDIIKLKISEDLTVTLSRFGIQQRVNEDGTV